MIGTVPVFKIKLKAVVANFVPFLPGANEEGMQREQRPAPWRDNLHVEAIG